MAKKPVIRIKTNSEGLKVFRNGKPEKPSELVADWASFRASLPTKKKEKQ